MAHHSSHRRILASSQEEPPNPSSSSSSSSSSSTMDPTLNKKHSKPFSAITTQPSTKNPDPKLLSKPFYLPKPNPSHKIITPATAAAHKQPTKNPAQPPPCIDTHLQARAMTVSADFDTRKFSLSKPKQNQKQQKPLVDAKMEKGSRRTGAIKEATSKEKVKTLSFSSQELPEKKKVQQVVVEENRKKKELQGTRKGDKEVKDLFEGLDIKRMSVSFGGGRRRRSICGSQVELSDFLASSGAKIVSVDMPPFMQIHAIDCARKTHDSLEKFTSKTLALTLKKEFDGVYGPAWHCIVGTSFGSFVTHSVGGFLYFSLDQKMYILLFKTTVQRAD